MIDTVKQTGVPMVVVTVSGRPLLLGDQLESWQALLAAWLPGTEGAGVADVLYGKYSPTGKLPVTWPRDLTKVTLNQGDEPYDPLFPYGYGLGY